MVKGLDASDTSDILSSKMFVREREEEYGSSPQLEEECGERSEAVGSCFIVQVYPGSIPI